jgi:hypothetical protein
MKEISVDIVELLLIDCTPPFEVYFRTDDQPDANIVYSRGLLFNVLLLVRLKRVSKVTN